MRDDEARDTMSMQSGPAQRKRATSRPGVGSFYADSAVTLHSSHWQLLTIQVCSTAEHQARSRPNVCLLFHGRRAPLLAS